MSKLFPLPGKGGGLLAVDSLSLSVPRNCVFGLLGPNGSGKSTTIRILLGLSRPSSGAASVFGSDPNDPKVRSRIGYLPDAPYYAKSLSGRELLQYFGKLSGMGRKERDLQSAELLDRFGLGDAMDRRLGGYSKGMLQRLGFAQALMGTPELLILDEPTAGVDPVGAEELAEFVLEQKREGKTVLLCSHFLTQVEALCDEVGILNKGRLLASGSLDSLLQKEDSGTFIVSGANAELLERFEGIAAAHGARIAPRRHSLEDLFHSLIDPKGKERRGS